MLGPFSSAAVAGPVSPLKPALPSPATVMILPVALTTSRTTLLPPSTMNRSPAESTATPQGPLSSAAVAGPLLPV